MPKYDFHFFSENNNEKGKIIIPPKMRNPLPKWDLLFLTKNNNDKGIAHWKMIIPPQFVTNEKPLPKWDLSSFTFLSL